MRPARFHDLIKLKCEPELRDAITAAAERDQTTVSEFLRRELRAVLTARRPVSSDTDPRPPAGSAAAMQAASDFEEAPGTAYARDQALGAVMRSAAARGGLAGGNATADILKTATGLADQNYDKYVSNLKDGAGFYGQGLAGQAQGLAGQAQASQSLGQQLSALGTGLGTAQAGVYGTGANLQQSYGQNVAGVQTNAANALVNNNNTLAKGQTAASANLLGGLVGLGTNIAGGLGGAGGLSSLFGGTGSGGVFGSGGGEFGLGGFRSDQWV